MATQPPFDENVYGAQCLLSWGATQLTQEQGEQIADAWNTAWKTPGNPDYQDAVKRVMTALSNNRKFLIAQNMLGKMLAFAQVEYQGCPKALLFAWGDAIVATLAHGIVEDADFNALYEPWRSVMQPAAEAQDNAEEESPDDHNE